MNIYYSPKFCHKLTLSYKKFWMDKYLKIIRLALILDEFTYLVSHERLIIYNED